MELIQVLKAKIHRAEVTEAKLNYFGSITIDKLLLEACGLFQLEKVLITSMRTGVRLETYILEGEKGSGCICMNGPSAHFIKKGDQILIMAFKMITPEFISNHIPQIIFPSDKNKNFKFSNNVFH